MKENEKEEETKMKFDFIGGNLKLIEESSLQDYDELEEMLAKMFELKIKKQKKLFPALNEAIKEYEKFKIKKGGKDWDFYKTLLPKIKQYALKFKPQAIPLMLQGEESSVELTPCEVLNIMANCFFLNLRYVQLKMKKDHNRDFGSICFLSLYMSSSQNDV